MTQYRAALAIDPDHAAAAERLRRAETAAPGRPEASLALSYYDDARSVVREQAMGGVAWYLGDDPASAHLGVVTVRDRTLRMSGEWLRLGWEHALDPRWWVRVEQGVATYDQGHQSYRYLLRLGHAPSDRWAWTLEHRRDDVWETPRALERGIAVSDLTWTWTANWSDRLEHTGSLGHGWYSDDNRGLSHYQELIYRLHDEPLVTAGGGYAFGDFRRQAVPEDAYYSPGSVHTGFLRWFLLRRPSDLLRYGGEYTLSIDDDGAVGHHLRAHWDKSLAKDLWFELAGRYFWISTRFGGERYFERELSATLSKKF